VIAVVVAIGVVSPWPARPPSSTPAAQDACGTETNRHERDHDGLAAWGWGLEPLPSVPRGGIVEIERDVAPLEGVRIAES
jgi:hypothetical protein